MTRIVVLTSDRRLAAIETRLGRIERALTRTLIRQEQIMSAVDDLVTEVTEISDATTAVEAAVDGLLDRIDEVNEDPRVADAVTELRGLKTRLVAAALEGTDGTDEQPENDTPPDDDDAPATPTGDIEPPRV